MERSIRAWATALAGRIRLCGWNAALAGRIRLCGWNAALAGRIGLRGWNAALAGRIGRHLPWVARLVADVGNPVRSWVANWGAHWGANRVWGRWLVWAVGLALVMLATHRAHAAPLPIQSELPLTADQIAPLRAEVGEAHWPDMLALLSRLRVYEDDGNAQVQCGPRLFYLAPYFSADASLDSIGQQVIANDALMLLDALDELLLELHASPLLHLRFEQLVATYDQLATALAEAVPNFVDPDAIAAGIAYAGPDNPYAELAQGLLDSFSAALVQVSEATQQAIALELLQLSRDLGRDVSSCDENLAVTDPAELLRTQLPQIRAHIAQMTFGVRQATFVSGLTEFERELLSAYLRVRSDIDIVPLPVSAVRVESVAQTTAHSGILTDRITGPELIRGVNSATDGVCGVEHTCTAIIEYTAIGARSAALSTLGASLMPVMFAGDVVYDVPAQADMAQCDVSTVMDSSYLGFEYGTAGAAELLHLLRSRLDGNDGVSVTGASSDAQDRAYMSWLFASGYRDLLYEPVQMSSTQRPALVTDMLTSVGPDHAGAPVGTAGVLVTEIGSESAALLQRVYEQSATSVHLLRLPPETIGALFLTASGPMPNTLRFRFDGFPLVCWTRSEIGEPQLSACPDANMPFDTQIGRSEDVEENLCHYDPFDLCLQTIDALPANSAGFLDWWPQ